MTDATNPLNNLHGIDVEALKKANPEAYGLPATAVDVVPDAAAEAARVAAEAATAEAAAEAARVAAEAKPDAAIKDAAAVVADPAKTSPPMIPKARFDEVLVESKNKDATLAEKDAQIAALNAKLNPVVVRDFDKENLDLATKYDNGDIEREDFLKEQRKLQREEITATATAIADQRIADRDVQAATQSAEQAFAAADTAWTAANAELLAVDGAKEAMQTAIEVVDKQHGFKLAPADLFEKAGRVAAAMLGKAPAAAAATTFVDPNAARNAADARAQAAASGVPAPLTGGMGDRSAAATIDITTLKQGDFGKLSQADQDKALGITA